MKFVSEKKGLSPVIATTLLILLAIIIAVIILLWIRSYVTEKAEKDLGDGPQALENICQFVKFNAELSAIDTPPLNNIIDKIAAHIVNEGNVPIYGVELKKKGISSLILGVINKAEGDFGIKSGEDYEKDLSVENKGLIKGTKTIIVITPILLGESGNAKKAYVCNEDYSIEVELE